MGVFSALAILVNHAEVSQIEESGVAGPPTKVGVLRPAALRVVFAAQGQVGAAVDGPKVALTDDRPLAGGATKMRDQ